MLRMHKFLKDNKVLKTCHVYSMLKKYARKRHASFHTPGHKVGKWDITELAYSDNLSAPHGCIAWAEKDVAQILGANKSFILTDGSTSGIFSMLYAAKRAGAKTVATGDNAHKSVWNACRVLGLTPFVFSIEKKNGVPLPVTAQTLQCIAKPAFEKADVLLLTSPDYYGNVAELAEISALCQKEGKLFLIDGAHGGHLHFDRSLYAGEYADMWVDGVHKSLPAFTQGAVVSARTESLSEHLYEGVQIFRTTSPSYPIMASVEYAVKYPRNEDLERAVKATVDALTPAAFVGDDWTKLCVRFGENAFEAQKRLQKKGVYAEFCDGDVLMFYLSPATTLRQLSSLQKTLFKLLQKYPFTVTFPSRSSKQTTDEKQLDCIPAWVKWEKTEEKIWVDMQKAEGKICAGDCGLFPPCTPLIRQGERVSKEALELLKKSDNVYGVWEEKILVYATEQKL